MRKFICFLLVIAAALSLCACGGPVEEETIPLVTEEVVEEVIMVTMPPETIPPTEPIIIETEPPVVETEPVIIETESEVEEEVIIVYITDTGSKYHLGNCRHLKSSNPIPLETARRNYDPCGTCNPDRHYN